MSPTQEQIDHDMHRAAFEQNHLAFRSLNQQMWQIPLISMTLTGGLWFGVSRVEDFPLFQLALLFLAAAGNGALSIVILRLRFVMQRYLNWLEDNYPTGFVSADDGEHWYHKSFVVRTSFQAMLLLASALSIVLFIVTGCNTWKEAKGHMPDDRALTYYQQHASSLADGYEALTFEAAHPGLAKIMTTDRAGEKLRVLDIGAGTGRDAAWFASHGLHVVAVEPSQAMRTLAQTLHAGLSIDWREDRLPGLEEMLNRGERFDIIVASAVWMHVRPDDRKQALQSIVSLLADQGMLYLTLRLGPEEPERGIHKVSLEGFKATAESLGLKVQELETQADLLGRPHIQWQALRIDAWSE
ncbi:class I SAM-dependent methyltransferase [Salipiger profundus]|uniref:class I SAM-dependent methyltransferase n=1 Tax=Salipiger profundus TaxID=1229727 RepID=UPI0008E1D1D3|nr:class I SAM-dependent methyltransferase [Salipiger profundus]SFD95111.1 Methyltransferase domain-containing protein [Salipiger profundus]